MNNPYAQLNQYIDRYGEELGKELFLDLSEEEIYKDIFPDVLTWITIRKEILNNDI